jgi:hypothetical protein
MKNLLLWLALSAFFSSCNYYSVYVRKQAENFEEAGMKRFEKVEEIAMDLPISDLISALKCKWIL